MVFLVTSGYLWQSSFLDADFRLDLLSGLLFGNVAVPPLNLPGAKLS